MSRVEIRRATIADVATIHQALGELAQHLGGSDIFALTPEALRRHGFGADPAFAVMLAEIDGRFAGLCLYFRTFSTWYGTPGLYVQDLYTAAEHRGAGLGEALLAAVAAEGAAAGASHLRLAVDPTNAGARRFYDRLRLEICEHDEMRMIAGSDFAELAARHAGS